MGRNRINDQNTTLVFYLIIIVFELFTLLWKVLGNVLWMSLCFAIMPLIAELGVCKLSSVGMECT